MLLALSLQQHGYEMTVVSERTAEDLRTGRVISNQCMFDRALRHERSEGLNFWDEKAPPVKGIAFGAGQPGVPEPVIHWASPLDRPAQSVDQRLKMSDWLTEFARRGGEIRHGRVEPEGLAELAREFELVLVAAGRGPQFGQLFQRQPELSPFSEPQRTISLAYLTPNQPEFYQGVTFGLAPEGEWFSLPILSVSGPVYGVYFSGHIDGPLDCFGDVRDTDHYMEVATKAVDRHFPWLSFVLRNASLNGPLDYLRGRVTPVVRDPVGTLDSGAKVLAMGDTAVTNDPIAGQGANMAAHCAAAYQRTILEQGDRPFDEEFMRLAFSRFWETAKHAVRFSNDLLAPPLPHVMATLQAAQANPVVAHRFAHLFNDNSDYSPWLTDESVAMAYLDAVA